MILSKLILSMSLSRRLQDSSICSDENRDNWIPSDPEVFAEVKIDWQKLSTRFGRYQYNPQYQNENECKWKALRTPKIPEPQFNAVDYTPTPEQRLVHKFRRSGLQVIVKLAAIELTPEKPVFKAGGWHVGIFLLSDLR
jgi:hypothetical protein